MRWLPVKRSVRLLSAGLLIGAATTLSPVVSERKRPSDSAAENGETDVRVVNMSSTASMSASLSLMPGTGDATLDHQLPALLPLELTSIFDGGFSPPSGVYALRSAADQPHALLARTVWQSGGLAFNAAVQPDSTVILPVWRGADGRNSIVTIQNRSAERLAQAEVQVYQYAAGSKLVNMTYDVPPGGAITLDIASRPEYRDLNDLHVAVMKVVAPNWHFNPTPFAVSSIVMSTESAQATFAVDGDAWGRQVGPGLETAVEHWWAPRLDVGTEGGIRHAAKLIVVNAWLAATEVKVTYHGLSGACAGRSFVHGDEWQILAQGAREYSLGPDGSDEVTGPSGLPLPCTVWAEIQARGYYTESAGSVLAYAVREARRDSDGALESSSGYRAAFINDLGQTLLVPWYTRDHGASELSTELVLVNPGSTAASAQLRYTQDGVGPVPCDNRCVVAVPAGGVVRRAADDSPMQIGASGSLRVDSDQPLAGLILESPRSGAGDADGYLAIPSDLPGVVEDRIRLLPRVLNRAPATGSDVPPGSLWHVTVSAFVDVAGGIDPSCPICNGVSDPEDLSYAGVRPLPPLSIEIRDSQGREVGRTASAPSNLGQVAVIPVTPLARGQAHVVAVTMPAGWSACPPVTDVWRLESDSFSREGEALIRIAVHDKQCTPITATPRATRVPTPTPDVRGVMPKLAAITSLSAINLDAGAAADLRWDLVSETGGLADHDLIQGLPFERFYTQGVNEFSVGNANRLPAMLYGAMLTSTSATAGGATIRWPDNRARVDVESPEPGTDVVVPLATKGQYSINTLLAIQNMDRSAENEVNLEALAMDGQVVARSTVRLWPGATRGVDLGRFPDLADLKLRFVGSLRLKSREPIAAQVLLDFEHSAAAVAGYNGLPVQAASDTWYVPQVFADVPAEPTEPLLAMRRSRLAIANPSGAATTVRVSYLGSSGTCSSKTIDGRRSPFTISPGGMALVEVSEDGLPAGCVAAARLQAQASVVATVLETGETRYETISAAAFNAFAPGDGRRKVATLGLKHRDEVRVTERGHSQQSEVTVQNLSDDFASVRLRLIDGWTLRSVVCGSPCQATVPPGGAKTFSTDAMPFWGPSEDDVPPPGNPMRVGWGFVESDRPITVLVAWRSRSLLEDESIHSGFGYPANPGREPRTRVMPLALNQATIRRPGSFLIPYEPPPGRTIVKIRLPVLLKRW
jgi:hypothetical protein